MRTFVTLWVVLSMLFVNAGEARAADDVTGSQSSSFPFSLFSQLAKDKSKSNLLLSPLSVATALSMTYPGAAGETKTALARILNFPAKGDDAVNQQAKETLDSLRNPGGDTKLEIANALFGEKRVKFKQPFLDANKKYFDSEIQSLDFESPDSVKTINAWVSKKTHEKIPTIVENISADAILYLINAIYFKGSWEHKFEKAETTEQDFSTASGASKKVQMMYMSRDDFRYSENDQFQAINLPYADKRLSLYVFLPKKDSSLSQFESNLNQSSWEQWTARFSKHDGTLRLPRFKIDDKMELKQPLSDMGLEIAFDEGKADFSDMAEISQRIFISRVIHKTFMEVNEEGTEAAAVTGIEMSATSAAVNVAPPFEMVVDRPFFIALHDNQTGQILFAGHITEP